MKLSEQQSAFLNDVCKLIAFIQGEGFVCTGDNLWRSKVEAWVNALPANSTLHAESPNGLRWDFSDPVGGLGIPNSLHRQRLAIDLNIIKDDAIVTDKALLKPIGDYWQGLNAKNRAGMFFTKPDSDHFERQPE